MHLEFDLELEKIQEFIRKSNPRSLGIQLPDGLKQYGLELAEFIRGLGIEPIISGDSCYGGCDLDCWLMERSEMMIHFGHSEMISHPKLIWLECRSKLKLDIGLQRLAQAVGDFSKIGLISSLQYLDQLDQVKRYLEAEGKQVILGRGSRARYPGQVLGCDYSAARIDCDQLVFVGSGDFHPLGACVAIGSKVMGLDVYTQQIKIYDPDQLIRKRMAKIAKLRSIPNPRLGVILGKKPGQLRLELGIEIAEQLREAGYRYMIVAMDEIDDLKLVEFNLDGWVNTACPRVALDMEFSVPVITPVELQILLGKLGFDQYRLDEMV